MTAGIITSVGQVVAGTGIRLDGATVQGDDEVHLWMGGWNSGTPVEIDVVRGPEPRTFVVVPSVQAA